MTYLTYSDYIYNTDSISYTCIHWTGSKIDNDSVKKSSLFIPVQIKGIDKKLFMQLDLGANISLLYGKTLNSFEQLDSLLKTKHKTYKAKHYMQDVLIEINQGTSIKANQIRILNNFGSEFIDTSFVVIGTLGYDIIGDQKLIIDYKNDRIALTKTIPVELENKLTYISNVDLEKFPIILPFILNGKKVRLLYDTGSSLFPLITGTNRLNKYAKHQSVDTIFGLSSWGKISKTYKVKDAARLKLGDFDFGNIDVYGNKDLNRLKLMGKYLYGFTGNVNFDKMIVVIDRKDNKFGLIN